MKKTETIKFIVDWIKNYKETNNLNGFVVGVSGGVDSALTSTLCALSGIKTLCLNMPIKQKKEQYQRAERHIQWLKKKFDNIESCLLYTSPSPRDGLLSRMPSSA